MVYEMPLTTKGNRGRSKRRRRRRLAGETIGEAIEKSRATAISQASEQRPERDKARSPKWSHMFAAITATTIFPAYLLWIIFLAEASGNGASMGRGAPHFFMFFVNLPFCILWLFLDHRDDPGSDEPLSPRAREEYRKKRINWRRKNDVA